MAEPEMTLFETPDDAAFVAAVETGVRALENGRNVPYENVRTWLLSWGSGKELSPPECP